MASVCGERAMRAGDIILEKIEAEGVAANIALPLRHEDRTVGALLLRIARKCC